MCTATQVNLSGVLFFKLMLSGTSLKYLWASSALKGGYMWLLFEGSLFDCGVIVFLNQHQVGKINKMDKLEIFSIVSGHHAGAYLGFSGRGC